MSTVLVVDDDPGIRTLARLTLSLDGYSVPTASGGPEALEVLTREHIDLMVLDLRMPGMDGAETLQEARREGYDGPVLILSAFGAKPAAEQLLADDAIDKPFDPGELSGHVHRLLEVNARPRST
jgi:CheY-like chemotaxis protein